MVAIVSTRPHASATSGAMRDAVAASAIRSAADSMLPATGLAAAATVKGSSNQKVLPRPTVLLTPMVPDMSSTSCFAMVVPRPVPP